MTCSRSAGSLASSRLCCRATVGRSSRRSAIRSARPSRGSGIGPTSHGDWVGAWLVGGDSVVNWFMHFGTEHGLNAADLTRFDELAKSNWLKAAIPTAPSWPQINEAPVGRCS